MINKSLGYLRDINFYVSDRGYFSKNDEQVLCEIFKKFTDLCNELDLNPISTLLLHDGLCYKINPRLQEHIEKYFPDFNDVEWSCDSPYDNNNKFGTFYFTDFSEKHLYIYIDVEEYNHGETSCSCIAIDDATDIFECLYKGDLQ